MNLTDTIEIKVSKYRRGKPALILRETVPAKIYGPLAIHHDVAYGKRQTWKITHIATGLCVSGELTLKAAVAIAKELKALPEWQEPTLGEGRTATNGAVFDSLANAVIEARRFHTGAGVREAA